MKKAIIVGATSGIGKELATILANDNYKVGITGRREHLLDELRLANPDAYICRKMDVTNFQETVSGLNSLSAQLGSLDLFIICSGIGDINEYLDFETEKITIDTNITGFTNAACWAFNYFEKQKNGHLVAVTSIGGLRGSRQAPAYNASKAYQINYLEGLRQKNHKMKSSVYITDIRPGLVSTNMAKGDGLFWVMPVVKTANQIYKAIKKKKKVAYVTKRWRLIAYILKMLPPVIYKRL